MKHSKKTITTLVLSMTAVAVLSGCAQRLHGGFRADDATVVAIDRETNVQRAEFAAMEARRAADEAKAGTPETPPPADYYGPVPAQRTYPADNYSNDPTP